MSEQVNHDFQPSSSSGGGFNFDNVHRNAMIQQMLAGAPSPISASSPSSAPPKLPEATKTGTTISGCIFDGGVVLGADTRATGGEEVAEKNCRKIHYIAPNVYCVGAGTAADADKTADLVSSRLALLRMDMNSKQSRVITAVTMLRQLLFRYQGHIGAAYVLGGVDVSGPHLFEIHSHGSTEKLPFTSSGSGGLAAMSVLESSWRDGMTEAEAVEVVKRSILAGVFNDLGSGSNCDIIVLRTDGSVDMKRGFVLANPVEPLRNAIQHSGRLVVPPGVTPILNESFTPHPPSTDEEPVVAATAMEVEG